jgi:hypothetical protein
MKFGGKMFQFIKGKQIAMNHPEVNYGILKSEGQEKEAVCGD